MEISSLTTEQNSKTILTYTHRFDLKPFHRARIPHKPR